MNTGIFDTFPNASYIDLNARGDSDTRHDLEGGLGPFSKEVLTKQIIWLKGKIWQKVWQIL